MGGDPIFTMDQRQNLEFSKARILIDKMEKVLSPEDFGKFLARCKRNGANLDEIMGAKKWVKKKANWLRFRR